MGQPVKISAKLLLDARVIGRSRPLSAALASVDAPQGRARVTKYLAEEPYPHYEADPDDPALLIRIDADGRALAGDS